MTLLLMMHKLDTELMHQLQDRNFRVSGKVGWKLQSRYELKLPCDRNKVKYREIHYNMGQKNGVNRLNLVQKATDFK